ncbi:MAG: superoxide dismutase [Fe] [Bradymonadales bacterium]|nr:superoxide dismutase [Fe] [Bradymonadales bacterium]
MSFTLPELPYPKNALEPHISSETLEYHHGKHHAAYVSNLNSLTEGTPWAEKSLEAIIQEAEGGIFNNGAQVFNHTFYFNGLSPTGGGEPTGAMADAIVKNFGSFSAFQEQFTKAALTRFGSGWAWLVQDDTGKLSVESTANADCPIRAGKRPLLTCDVWEHAYYIDYRNARPNYLESFWKLVNWEFVAQNLR